MSLRYRLRKLHDTDINTDNVKLDELVRSIDSNKVYVRTEEGIFDISTSREMAEITPYIGADGNWYIGGTNLNKPSRGEKGEKGEDGPPGLQGEQGVQGVKGDPFLYSDFTVEQLAGLKGDKGDKGDVGPTGIQGPQGETGAQGNAFKYENFTKEQLEGLKGPKGDKGDTGRSSYDIAVENGFTGTEEEYWEYLGSFEQIRTDTSSYASASATSATNAQASATSAQESATQAQAIKDSIDYATEVEALAGVAENKTITPKTLHKVLDYDSLNFVGAEFDGVHSAGTRLGKATGWAWSKSSELVAGDDDFKNYAPFNQQRFLVKTNADGVAEIVDWEGTATFASRVNDDAYGAEEFIKFPLAYVKRVVNANGKETRLVSDQYLPGYHVPRCFIRNGKVLPFIGISRRSWHKDGNGSITTRSGKPPMYNKTETQFEEMARAKGLYIMGQDEVNYLQHLGSIKYADLNWQSVVGQGMSSTYNTKDNACTVAQTSTDSIIVSTVVANTFEVGQEVFISGNGSQQSDLKITAIDTYDTSNSKITIAGMTLTSVVGATGLYRACSRGGGAEGILGLDGEYSTGTNGKKDVMTLGLENLYGNQWKLLGGACRIGNDIWINPSPETSYTFPTDATNAQSLGWVKLNGTLSSTNGYVKTLVFDKGFPLTNYPATVGGDSANPVGDYFYTNANTMPCVVLFGGYLNYGGYDGPFCVNVYYGVGFAYWGCGAFGVYLPS